MQQDKKKEKVAIIAVQRNNENLDLEELEG